MWVGASTGHIRKQVSSLVILLHTMPGLSGPGVWVGLGQVQGSNGRGFSEWVTALTHLLCLGFSRRRRAHHEEQRQEEQRGEKAMSAEWTVIHGDVI